MDALTFLKERSRMCDTHRGKGNGCKGCPLDKEVDNVCSVWCFRNPEKVISIVEQWVNEHPHKTRQSELLKQWPNAKLCENDLRICPNLIDKDYMPVRGCDGTSCYRCKEQFWTEEID